MTFELPALPFAETALEPYMSARTLQIHHGKHHQAYVTKLNELVRGGTLANKSLEEIIRFTVDDNATVGIFHNAAQVWNHNFFWNSLTPHGGGEPTGPLASAISRTFGSFHKFSDAFKEMAVGEFGSGWVWLVAEKGKLRIVKTDDAGTPITDGQTPLITIDVWEHAYYLDYQNRRPDYIQTYLDKLINWKFAAANFAKVST
jgi:Fe-Mn family superoxide dismutase